MPQQIVDRVVILFDQRLRLIRLDVLRRERGRLAGRSSSFWALQTFLELRYVIPEDRQFFCDSFRQLVDLDDARGRSYQRRQVTSDGSVTRLELFVELGESRLYVDQPQSYLAGGSVGRI